MTITYVFLSSGFNNKKKIQYFFIPTLPPIRATFYKETNVFITADQL